MESIKVKGRGLDVHYFSGMHAAQIYLTKMETGGLDWCIPGCLTAAPECCM